MVSRNTSSLTDLKFSHIAARCRSHCLHCNVGVASSHELLTLIIS